MLTIRLATSADHAAIEALWAEAQLPTVSTTEVAPAGIVTLAGSVA